MFFDFLLCLVAMIVSFIIFDIIFYALNHSLLMLFVPVQNKISNMKNKVFLKWFLYTIFLGISVMFKTSFNLNYFLFGISLGFFYSLSRMLVGESIIV